MGQPKLDSYASEICIEDGGVDETREMDAKHQQYAGLHHGCAYLPCQSTPSTS
jgi:hypothetical protein